MIKRDSDNHDAPQIIPGADEILHTEDVLVVMGRSKDIETLKHVT